MTTFEDLKWLALSACLLVDVVCLHFMVRQANKRLPPRAEIAVFLSRRGNVADVYRRLYPEGRAYQVLRVSVTITAIFSVALVLIYLWSLLAAR